MLLHNISVRLAWVSEILFLAWRQVLCDIDKTKWQNYHWVSLWRSVIIYVSWVFLQKYWCWHKYVELRSAYVQLLILITFHLKSGKHISDCWCHEAKLAIRKSSHSINIWLTICMYLHFTGCSVANIVSCRVRFGFT